jgi:predicted aminopeptidase
MHKRKDRAIAPGRTAPALPHLPSWLICLAVLLLCPLLAGCFELGYYRQAVEGQWQLLSQRRDIEELILDQDTPAALRLRLELALEMRDFASRELFLPDNRSYRTFVELDRPYAVWNVVATPQLSLEPVTWCFPVAGCVPYRGYFNPDDARRFAAQLSAEEHDVQVYGVTAYSTLNWFADPILSTFVYHREANLAGLLFHELAHQQLYVKDDGTFNESFARTVELVGVQRWMDAHGDPAQIAAYELHQERHAAFIELLLATRTKLEELYRNTAADADKLLEKEQLISRFREDYQQLKQQWGGDDRFDRWVDRPLNNAHFALIATYNRYVPAFMALLAEHDGDLPRFYAAASALSRQPRAERHKVLQSLP